MDREQINKLKEEWLEKVCGPIPLHREGFSIGFSSCADILLPEIESLKEDLETVRSSLKFRNLTAISRADRLDSKDDKITQLEKENAELRTDIHLLTKTDKITVRHLKEPINEHHVYNIKEQSKVIDKLTAQLAIATEALEHYQEIESRTFSKLAVATKALAKIKDVK